MKNKKIVILVSRFIKSGPNNVVNNLIRNLKNKDIYLISLSKGMGDDFLNYKAEKYCNKIASLNDKKCYYIFPKKLVDDIELLVGKFDVIHTHGFRADFLISRTWASKKQVSTIHNYMVEDYPERYGNFIGKIMVDLHLKALRKIRFPILCSGSLVEQYSKNGLFFDFIDNGIDDNKFNISADTKIIENDKIRIASVGHLSRIKNPIFIAQAYRNFNSTVSNNLEVLFIGDGELMGELKKYEQRGLKAIGFQTDVKNYLLQSDYFISSSTTEGLPNAALEAAFTGLPLLLSDIPSHLYLKKQIPESVYLFSSIDNLSEIFYKISIGEFKIKQPNIEVLRSKFSAKVMAEKYSEIYDRLSEVSYENARQ